MFDLTLCIILSSVSVVLCLARCVDRLCGWDGSVVPSPDTQETYTTLFKN